MSSKLAMLLLLLIAPFHHPEANTEWWYYTGNLKSQDGHRYGYELTFFRQVNHDAPKATRSGTRRNFTWRIWR